MKKWTSLLAGLLALSVIAGCAPQGSTPSPTPTPVVSDSPTTSPTPSTVPLPLDTLRLTREEFPRLDGSTSTAPLAEAVCAVLLGESREEAADLVHFNRTTQSYRNLIHGFVDLLIAAEPANSVVEEKKEAGFEWEMAPIATDALVFVINENNPVDDLTWEQVQKIYTGEITNWKEVGGEDRPILPFQRNEEAGSQTLMKKLVMDDLELMEPEKDYLVDSMSGLIEAVRSFDGSPGAIGYTVYYYANDMNMAEGLKVVSIDGAAPDAATIRSGAYPFTNPYYTTIAADALEDSPARQVFDWLQGPIGQSLIQHEGYVSILDDPAPIEWDLGETEPLAEVYTRLSDGPLPELVPADDYGPLLSYVGSTLPSSWGWEFEKYGLVTREGKIVTDSVYDSVYQLSWYDNDGKRTSHSMGILQLTRAIGEGEQARNMVALAAADGSWVTGFDWLSVSAVAEDRLWAVLPNGDGVMLDTSLKELWRLPLPEGEETWVYQGGNIGTMWWNGGVGYYYLTNSGTGNMIDLDGNVIDFADKGIVNVQGFRNGISRAQDNGGFWGYINQAGEWVIEPKYDECWNFEDGKAIVRDGGVCKVIDTAGNLLLDADYPLLSRQSDRGTWYMAYSDVQTAQGYGGYRVEAVYDQDLKPLEWDWVGQTVQWADNESFWRKVENGIEVGNPYETVTFPVREKAEYHNRYGELVTFCRKEENVTGMTDFYYSAWTMDGENIIEETQCRYLGMISDTVTGEHYLYADEGSRSQLYDTRGNYLTDCTSYTMVTDGLVPVLTDLSYGYKTLDGEWVFRISLMKSQED